MQAAEQTAGAAVVEVAGFVAVELVEVAAATEQVERAERLEQRWASFPRCLTLRTAEILRLSALIQLPTALQ